MLKTRFFIWEKSDWRYIEGSIRSKSDNEEGICLLNIRLDEMKVPADELRVPADEMKLPADAEKHLLGPERNKREVWYANDFIGREEVDCKTFRVT